MNIYNENLLEWLTWYGLGSWSIAVSYQEAENPVVTQPTRLAISVVPIWRQKPRGFLEGYWSSFCFGTPTKSWSNTSKGTQQQEDRWIASKNWKSQVSFHLLLICHHTEALPPFSTTTLWPWKSLAALLFSWFQIQSHWRPLLTIILA